MRRARSCGSPATRHVPTRFPFFASSFLHVPVLHRLAVAAAVLVLLAPCPVRAQAPADSLAETVRALTEAPNLGGATCGVAALEEATGQPLVRLRADRPLVPASNAKLLTTAAAFDVLGPDFRYVTRLYAAGPIAGTTLEGPLVVRGSGDPTLGFTDGDAINTSVDPSGLFRRWAKGVRRRGITQVTGGVIGDDSVFADDVFGLDEATGAGWTYDDTPYGYAAEVSGLAFAHNRIDLRVQAREPGEPGTLSWTPATDYVTVVNRTVTRPRGRRTKERYRRSPGSNTILVASGVPVGRVEREKLTVANPTAFAAHVFREALLAEAVGVRGQALDADDLPFPPTYPDADTTSPLRLLLTHTSPPLRVIARATNVASRNLYAEQLLRTLGVVRPSADVPGYVPAGSARMGAAVVMAMLARAGGDTSRVRVVDGSGLSRLNLVTPDALAALLRYMARHPRPEVAEAFRASLPTGGEGTLRYRFQTGPAVGRVRAKTGTLTGVSALSGYVEAAGGTPLVFAIVCNNYTVRGRVVRRMQDAIVERLAQYAE
jgi:D-alanyl-D-alanine carboxypeptidase/D-alanyl-D-alanine-endopeptidase (penicillin-binding protein 4)